MIVCEQTGQAGITREFADYLIKHRDIPAEYFTVNDQTHRKELALTMGRISQWGQKEQS